MGKHAELRPGRRRPLVALLAVLALALGGWALLGRGTDGAAQAATVVPPGASTAAPTPSPTTPAYAAEVTRLTNVERAKVGCPALRVEPKLQKAAQLHSEDMVNRNYFSHTSPDGDGPGERAAAQGYPTWSGENIAAGYPTPAEVVQGWMNSPGHKANILNCQSKSTGVGYDPRGSFWTQMFGFV